MKPCAIETVSKTQDDAICQSVWSLLEMSEVEDPTYDRWQKAAESSNLNEGKNVRIGLSGEGWSVNDAVD